MEELLTLLKENWLAAILIVVGVFKCFRKAVEGAEWFIKKFGLETKSMRKKRENEERLSKTEKDIEEIKEASKRNVQLFLEHEQQVVGKFTGIKDEIVAELNKLHEKIDAQKAEMNATNKANTKTDLAMLRDRIASGMRYFSQNIGDDGKVHVSLSDYENMDALYQQYFAKGGNGAFRKMYEDEFRHFVIDQQVRAEHEKAFEKH